MHTVAVVGIGEDGLEGLRQEARRVVEEADVLVGGERHQRLLPEHPAERLVFKRDAARLAEDVKRLLDEGRRVAVLASGDPVYFGIGPVLCDRLGAERVRIYPDVGAVQLAFARLGLAWQDAVVVSAHSRALDPVVRAALCSVKVAILTDTLNTPMAIARALMDAGVEPTARTWCLQRLGGPAERIQHGTLADCATWSVDPLNVLVIVREARCVRGPALSLGLAEDAYEHARGQITKADVRVLSLVRLGLRSGDVLWDIGAGSGSVSIEAASLCAPSGTVYAIERQPEQQTCIRANILRHGALNVELVVGEAPEVLTGLADPDGVFVGGSGGQMQFILDTCLARLRQGGRLVLNLATLENVGASLSIFKDHGLAAEVTHVSIARGTSIGGGTRLAPLNPVFIVSTRVERQ